MPIIPTLGDALVKKNQISPDTGNVFLAIAHICPHSPPLGQDIDRCIGDRCLIVPKLSFSVLPRLVKLMQCNLSIQIKAKTRSEKLIRVDWCVVKDCEWSSLRKFCTVDKCSVDPVKVFPWSCSNLPQIKMIAFVTMIMVMMLFVLQVWGLVRQENSVRQ